jgi:hypothetical protein
VSGCRYRIEGCVWRERVSKYESTRSKYGEGVLVMERVDTERRGVSWLCSFWEVGSK